MEASRGWAVGALACAALELGGCTSGGASSGGAGAEGSGGSAEAAATATTTGGAATSEATATSDWLDAWQFDFQREMVPWEDAPLVWATRDSRPMDSRNQVEALGNGVMVESIDSTPEGADGVAPDRGTVRLSLLDGSGEWLLSAADLGHEGYVFGAVALAGPGEALAELYPSSDGPGAADADQPGGLLYSVDTADGSLTPVEPPAGLAWGTTAGPVSTGDGFVAVATSADPRQSCVVAIAGTSASTLHCFEGETVAGLSASPDGATVLLGAAGDAEQEDGADTCRRLVFVPSDGGDVRELGRPGECASFEGVVLDGWSIWGMAGSADPATLDVRLFADGPDGQELAFGPYDKNTLVACGGYVYWTTTVTDEQGDSYDSVMRWRPGAPSAERVLSNGPEERAADTYLGSPQCSDGVLSLARVRADEDPGLQETLVLSENG